MKCLFLLFLLIFSINCNAQSPDVTTYGALPNDGLDDTVAIQAAVTSALLNDHEGEANSDNIIFSGYTLFYELDVGMRVNNDQGMAFSFQSLLCQSFET